MRARRDVKTKIDVVLLAWRSWSRSVVLAVVCLFSFWLPAEALSGEIAQKRGKALLKLECENLDSTSNSIRLSDEVKITLSVEGGANLTVESAGHVTPSRDWHVTRRTDSEKVRLANGSYRWQQSIYLDPVKPGELSLPVAPLRFRDPPGDREWQEVKWTPVLLRVSTDVRNVNTSELRDITPPEELPPKSSHVGLFALATGFVLAAGLLIGAGEYFRRRTRHKAAISPDECALRDLQSIANMRPAGELAIQQFHFRLSEILRNYLELRFQLPATTRTTTEYLELLNGSPFLTESQRDGVSEILKRCDLVKFARVTPAPEQCAILAARSRSLIEETAEKKDHYQPNQPD
jgi:hypothetical protein